MVKEENQRRTDAGKGRSRSGQPLQAGTKWSALQQKTLLLSLQRKIITITIIKHQLLFITLYSHSPATSFQTENNKQTIKTERERNCTKASSKHMLLSCWGDHTSSSGFLLTQTVLQHTTPRSLFIPVIHWFTATKASEIKTQQNWADA